MGGRGDRLVGLFLLGVALFTPPLLMLPTGATVFGWPASYVYLHVVWIVLVVLTAWLTRRGDTPEKGGDAS
jgi:membrane protein implicated in regulation of membrane protease activity